MIKLFHLMLTYAYVCIYIKYASQNYFLCHQLPFIFYFVYLTQLLNIYEVFVFTIIIIFFFIINVYLYQSPLTSLTNSLIVSITDSLGFILASSGPETGESKINYTSIGLFFLFIIGAEHAQSTIARLYVCTFFLSQLWCRALRSSQKIQ